MSIPVLDLQNLSASELDQACREWGFFALRGHDFAHQERHAALSAMQTFFAQPLQHKNAIRRSATNCWGFYDAELTKNRRDWKEIVDIGAPADTGPLAGANPQWPDLADFRQPIEIAQMRLHATALAVVAAIADALQAQLDVPAAFADHTSFLRLNYYPICPQPARGNNSLESDEGHLGISRHTDAGAVTVLMQDGQSGLQVHQHNRWHDVAPQSDQLIINIGDIVQVWSNDRYCAPLHRVLAHDTQPRYSLPYFLNPAYTYNYAPLASPLKQDPDRYQAINWGEFRSRRSAGDYADEGTEIQISDYRLSA